MTSRDERLHQRVWDLLPWYANDTLEAAERALVEDHLAGCARCRDEAAACRRLRAELQRAPEVAPAPHPARLAQLLARLDEAEGRPGGLGRLRSLFGATPVAVRWAVAAHFALIVVLAGALALRPGENGPEPLFRTLSDPAPRATPAAPAVRLRVVFAEEATERQIREVLLGVRGQLAGGPSPLGAYTVVIPAAESAPDPPEIVLAYLRSHPLVRFAEPLADLPAGGS